MSITVFLKLVELPTKVASVIPFLFGTLYALYAFDSFDWKNAVLMFLAMLIFDMTTTAINNYIDFMTARKKDGYGYEIHNAMGAYDLSPQLVRILIYIMLAVSTVLGLCLVYRTNLTVLVFGVLCFAIGILYTSGPLPISRTPFGEVFSGFTMGLVLTFITIYIHVFDQDLLNLSFSDWQVNLNFNLKILIGIFLVCVPLINCIANIMIANNLCDMAEDLINKRYTLPIYIGKKSGLVLWEVLYYLSYIAIVIGVLIGYLPWLCLLTLITLIPIRKNIAAFKVHQTKKDTFIFAIKNFLTLNSYYILTLGFAILLKI